MRAPRELWPLQADAAIFDFDGTLADTAHIWHDVDRIFLSRRGLPFPAGYGEAIAALGFEQGARYTIDLFRLDESVEDICDEWNAIGREMYQREVELRDGAERYIRSLRSQGIPCALATTNDVRVLSSMRNFDPNDLFDACVYGAEVGKGKNEPDIYLEAAARIGTRPQDCLVFEDIVVAVRTAHDIGMRTCGVKSSDPVQRVDELRDLADLWLEEWTDIVL